MKKIARNISILIGIISLLFLFLEFTYLSSRATTPVSPLTLSQYLVGIVCIVCGIICAFPYANDKNSRPLVLFLYSYGLTIINIYVLPGKDDYFPPITYFLFDLFGLCTITSIFHFVSRSFRFSKYYNKMKKTESLICHSPSCLFIIKYLLILIIPQYTLTENSLRYMIHILFILLFFISAVLFMYLFLYTSRQYTMLLRFFTIGIFYAYCPSFLVLVKSLIHSDLVLSNEILVSSCISICYIPLIITMSIFLYKNEKINYYIRMIILFFGFSTLMVLLLQSFYEALTYEQFKTASACLIILSPYIYMTYRKLIETILSIESNSLTRSLENYKKTINESKSFYSLYNSTAEEIHNLLKCNFIFFYFFNNNQWNIAYSDTDKENSDYLISQSEKIKGKKTFYEFDDKSICIIIYNDNIPYLKIFIGRKQNEDRYLPTELIFVQRFLDLMCQRQLQMYSMNIESELVEISQHSQQMDKEIQLAAKIQKSFYPQNIESLKDWDIQFYCKAMAGVSGDLYDFYHKNDILNGLGIFDVSGHGISSGLVTMLVRNIIQDEFYKNLDLPLHEVLNIIDARFRKEKNNIENFMTGILLRFDDNTIQMVNAGHPHPLLYKKSEDKLYNFDEINPVHGTVIGFNFIEPKFTTIDFTMESGDILFLFTDGITEAKNDKKEQFGFQRFVESINSTIHESTKEQINSILADLNSFTGSMPATDDITFIILKKE